MKNNILYRAFQLIPPQQKREGLLVAFLLTISTLLDLVSLATFLPIIILIIKPEHLATNNFLSKLYSLSGVSEPVHFGILLTVAAIVFVFIKTKTNIRITHRKASYGYAIASVLSAHAFNRFLSNPYVLFSQSDHSKTLNRITNLPLVFANNLVIPAGTILSEGFITLILCGAVAVYDIKLFLFLGIFLAPLAWLYKQKRKSIKQSSEQIKATYPLLLKHTLQGIEGLAEIKAFQKEKFFEQRVNQAFNQLGKILSTDHTRNTSISRITELVAAIYIGLLIIYVLLFYSSKEDAILLLSIYAGVSFRTIPSINRIFSAFLQIKTHEYVVDELKGSQQQPDHSDDNVTPKLNFQNTIALKNLSFAYENQPEVLRGVSLTVNKGEKIILSGKSGNGKTTLLLLMLRFLKEQKGELVVDGKTLTDAETQSFRKLMGYVPQNPYILDASITENIAFGIPPESVDINKVKQLIRDLDLSDWIDLLPEKLNTIIGEKGAKISGGQRQRIAIARALYHDAEILLLDEITNQLDSKSEEEVLKTLHALALQIKTIVLVTHRKELWPMFDGVYELNNGGLKKLIITTLQENG